MHPSANVATFLEQYRGLLEKGWTLELRIRYIPASLEKLFEDDFVIFKFLYEQVLDDFLMLDLPTGLAATYQDLIIELGCLELRRLNPYLTPAGLEKSSNFEALEGEIHKFLPASFITTLKVRLGFHIQIFLPNSCFLVKTTSQADKEQVQEGLCTAAQDGHV